MSAAAAAAQQAAQAQQVRILTNPFVKISSSLDQIVSFPGLVSCVVLMIIHASGGCRCGSDVEELHRGSIELHAATAVPGHISWKKVHVRERVARRRPDSTATGCDAGGRHLGGQRRAGAARAAELLRVERATCGTAARIRPVWESGEKYSYFATKYLLVHRSNLFIILGSSSGIGICG